MSTYKKVKNWFRKDGHFSWGCNTKRVKDHPCVSIDVYIKEMHDSIDLDCAWTIISDDDTIYDDLNSNNHQVNVSIPVSHTHKFVQIYAANDDEKIEYEEIWPVNTKMPQETCQKIEDAKKNGKAIKNGNAWDPKAVSKAIGDWVWRQTGLTVDFTFDPKLNRIDLV